MKYKTTIKLRKQPKVVIKLKKNYLESKIKKTKSIFKIPKEIITKIRYVATKEEDFCGRILGFPLEGKYNGTLI